MLETLHFLNTISFGECRAEEVLGWKKIQSAPSKKNVASEWRGSYCRPGLSRWSGNTFLHFLNWIPNRAPVACWSFSRSIWCPGTGRGRNLRLHVILHSWLYRICLCLRSYISWDWLNRFWRQLPWRRRWSCQCNWSHRSEVSRT